MAFFLLAAFGPCANEAAKSGGVRAEEPSASRPSASSSSTRQPTTQAAQLEARPSPPPDPALRFEPVPILSEIRADVLAHLRAVASNGPEMNDDRVAKMGGSSVESRAFLHCLDSDEVDLGGRDGLQSTLDAFRRPSSGVASFSRRSLATKVGWSVRHAMGGRPPYVHREITALKPRWALAFFGGNDVEGRNDARYVERLDRLIDGLEGRGVVPILSSLTPRRRDQRKMERWVRRYNRATWAVATARLLPYVDVYPTLVALPGMGLARDGVHPNVMVRGPHSYGCDFTEEGLQHGQNQRNLRTLQILDRVRRVFVEGQEPAPALPVTEGSGTSRAPYRLRSLPYARRFEVEELPASTLGGYEGCGEHAGDGPELVFRFRVESPIRLWATTYALGPVEGQIFLLDADRSVGRCLGSFGDDGAIEIEAPGVYHLVVETSPRRLARDEAGDRSQGLLFALTTDPDEDAPAPSGSRRR